MAGATMAAMAKNILENIVQFPVPVVIDGGVKTKEGMTLFEHPMLGYHVGYGNGEVQRIVDNVGSQKGLRVVHSIFIEERTRLSGAMHPHSRMLERGVDPLVNFVYEGSSYSEICILSENAIDYVEKLAVRTGAELEFHEIISYATGALFAHREGLINLYKD